MADPKHELTNIVQTFIDGPSQQETTVIAKSNQPRSAITMINGSHAQTRMKPNEFDHRRVVETIEDYNSVSK